MCTYRAVLAAVCVFSISSAAFAEGPNLGLPLAEEDIPFYAHTS